MRYTHTNLFESRVDYVLTNLGSKLELAFVRDTGSKPRGPISAEQIVNKLSEVGDKFIVWTARQYLSGAIKWEDIPQVKQDIGIFQQLAKLGKIQNKDINSYSSISDLRKIIQLPIGSTEYNTKIEKLYHVLNDAVEHGNGKWLYNKPTDPIKIYVPLNLQGSIAIRKGYPTVKWCTTPDEDLEEIKRTVAIDILTQRLENIDHISNYDYDTAVERLSDRIWDEIQNGDHDDLISDVRQNQFDFYIHTYGGELYVILTPSGIFQLHFESGEFKDEFDNDLDIHKLIRKFPVVGHILKPLITDLGHPHFLTNYTTANVIKAIQVSMYNTNFFPEEVLQKLSSSEWTYLVEYYIEKTCVKPRQRMLDAHVFTILWFFASSMVAKHISTVILRETSENILVKYSKRISYRYVPETIVSCISREFYEKHVETYGSIKHKYNPRGS